ncbi:MAG: VIT and VWA domain-containing protein [Bryobacteraceae bacterium]|nr:VIT and VWA domain-containing protein [Bryobacteraceae bacterium]MDW8378073.1 VIT and VWA domain-containing protein [Bryobacterales bacterium]
MTLWRQILWWLAVSCAAPVLLWADTGVIIPSNRPQPDPKILSLAELDLDVLIDNQVARVRIRQIFQNHVGSLLEGQYSFSLPSRAVVSDFAVWDDVVRIPGLILERRRAEEVYRDIRFQALDPGLLQLGEQSAEQARRSMVFSARIVPIPAFGAKRVELEYHESIPVEQLQSQFAIPLQPDTYQLQTAGRFGVRFELRSKHPIKDFAMVSRVYAAKLEERTAQRIRASFEGSFVKLSEDFAVRWTLDGGRERLEVLTSKESTSEPGFFQASLLTVPSSFTAAARTVVALFDTSLSMQWEKLERSYQALEVLLRSLTPADRFSLILFNDQVQEVHQAPIEATPQAVDQALGAVRAARLRGGTNLQQALRAGLRQARGDQAYLVALGDGQPSRGLVQNAKLADWYAAEWSRIEPALRPHTYCFGVGDDANLPLLRSMARHKGVFEWVRSTEPVEFKLKAFVSKIGRRPWEGLILRTEPAANFDLIYPLEESVFPGSLASWIGRYQKGGPATFRVRNQTASVSLPAVTGSENSHLPRTWAKARVDALLEKIEREGEDVASIDEIIRLSRKYKFVTPYTSFLAAPRSLLRPRVIRPGDPILRIKTDPSIVSVTAVFPFGLVKKLRYLESEEIWQTRFLAPVDLKDGAHEVRVILRDRQGRVYRESKTFVIVSQPPVVRVKLDKTQYRRGEAVQLQVTASAHTRTIIARMIGASPAYLRWNEQRKSNTGTLIVPSHLPAGKYRITVLAEDFAHNIASQEAQLAVLP